MSLQWNSKAAALAAALAIAVPAGAAAQDAAAQAGAAPAAAAAQEVVARVGGQPITEEDVTIAGQEFASELVQVPEAQRRALTIDALVNMRLMAIAADEEGLDETERFARRLDFLKMQALRNAYVETSIIGGITPEEVEEAYQTLVVKDFKPEEQVRARHILVETKEAAEKIIADLKAGGSFEELAKQSKDPSGQNGGDLGFFARGQMVPPFEEAAFALEPGSFTQEPVETQFGWHVILVEEKRMSEPPALADVEEKLRGYLLRGKFEETLAALRAKYPIEIVGAPTEQAPAEAAPAETAPAETAPAEAPAEAPAGQAPAEAPAEAPAN